MSLAGGQGKTTVSTLLSKYLAQSHYSVLAVDCDPQANLTTNLGLKVKADEPTLLELLKGTVNLQDATYATDHSGINLVPADDGLDHAQDYLSSSGLGVLMLKRRLESAKNDVCLIDAPPQRSQLCKTIIGASDYLIIPCEANYKGYGSLVRTIDTLNELKELNATNATVLAVIPFRDRWIGNNQTKQSRDAIAAMAEEVGKDLISPSILESERYKQALDQRKTLDEIGHSSLRYPFDSLINILKAKI